MRSTRCFELSLRNGHFSQEYDLNKSLEVFSGAYSLIFLCNRKMQFTMKEGSVELKYNYVYIPSLPHSAMRHAGVDPAEEL